MRFIDVGAGNIVSEERIICVAAADSAPIRRIIQDSRDRSMLVECCAGRKCRSVIVTDSDHVIASSMKVDEIKAGLAK